MKFAIWLLGALIFQQVERNPTKAKVPYQRFTSCLEGWYQYGDKCFRVFGKSPKDWLSWQNARDACSNHGAQLASIHSKEENDFLVAYLLLNIGYYLWIGFNDLDVNRKYEWIDKSAVNFTIWDEGEPIEKKDGQPAHCVEIGFWANSDKLGKWRVRPCDLDRPYLCLLPTDSRLSNENPKYCPEGEKGSRLQDSCYTHVDLYMTWSDAEFHCQTTFGGHLVAITDAAVQRFLTYMLRELDITTTLWVGLKASGTKSIPLWFFGWHLAYTRWVDDNQQLQPGSCVSFLRSGLWEVVPCTMTFPFICEVSKVTPPKLEPNVEGAHCPEESADWKDLGGNYCYYFNTNDNVNFHEANFQCFLRGGTLASIHSKEELDSIEQFLRYKVWSVYIGFIRKYDNSFLWTDTSEVNFLNWDNNEPESNAPNKRCVQILAHGRSMRWFIVDCDNNRSYICSIKKKFPKTTEQMGMAFCPDQTFLIQ